MIYTVSLQNFGTFGKVYSWTLFYTIKIIFLYVYHTHTYMSYMYTDTYHMYVYNVQDVMPLNFIFYQQLNFKAYINLFLGRE